MPNMDGYEFAAHLHGDPLIANIPVIFYTASYREREAATVAHACGVQWILPKPSAPDELLMVVNEALGLQQEAVQPVFIDNSLCTDHQIIGLNGQISEYFAALENSSQLMSSMAMAAFGAANEPKQLTQAKQELTDSLSDVESIGLRLTALIEFGLELVAEKSAATMLQRGCRTAQNICIAKYAAIGIVGDYDDELIHFYACGLDNKLLPRSEPHMSRTGILHSS